MYYSLGRAMQKPVFGHMPTAMAQNQPEHAHSLIEVFTVR